MVLQTRWSSLALGLLMWAGAAFPLLGQEAPPKPATQEKSDKPVEERPRRTRTNRDGQNRDAADGAAKSADAEKQEGFSVTIAGDVSPEFAPVVGRMTALFFESYPQLVKRFEHPDKPAPRHVKLQFEPTLRVPAYCSGNQVTISVEWLTKHPDDIGLLTHELTHAVQAYPRNDYGWLTEGVADYARQLYGPKVQPGWSLPRKLSEKNSYKDSYRVVARFLVWLDERHPGAVDKVHRLMQDREFAPADFDRLTGKSLDALWVECVLELNKGE